MPELCRFNGMIIAMRWTERGQHNKPHIHVAGGDEDASVGIDGELLAGTLSPKKFKLLQAWLILHEEELYAAWNHAVRGEPCGKIAPLQ